MSVICTAPTASAQFLQDLRGTLQSKVLVMNILTRETLGEYATGAVPDGIGIQRSF